MRKIAVKGVFTLLAVFALLHAGVFPVAAQESVLPDELARIIERFPGGAGLVDFVTDNIRLLITVMWIALVLASVIYAGIAAFKYVTSQGDAGKIEEAQKAVKAIWMGVAAFFVSIIGMVVIVAIAGGSLATTVYETCILASGSEGCDVCNEQGIVEGNLCEYCEDEYDIKAIRSEYQVDARCSN
ncbi:MAG: hypothetical protein TR69_WS6001001366 [candidate division WS6 bacterium OLB20]|uniref:Uncharacterized protein n=1 Tax=candidate division WS6 bacterium OLB20 TaxID=1617426 RepID=A0A136LWP1_9BACT|nr:MAG: hypothetical protein TR69_WS6001001366 [candidate division WS6 bacterium OLB20]